MDQFLNMTSTIYKSLVGDEYEKWTMLCSRYSNFTTRFPLVSILMCHGIYNRNAFKKYCKLIESSPQRNDGDGFIDEQLKYARLLYRYLNAHYDVKKCIKFAESMRTLLETLYTKPDQTIDVAKQKLINMATKT